MAKKNDTEAAAKMRETAIVNQLSAAGFSGAQIAALLAVFAQK